MPQGKEILTIPNQNVSILIIQKMGKVKIMKQLSVSCDLTRGQLKAE